jgi:CheY-like chemotaxis protein
VDDTGVGVSEDSKDLLFKPYFQEYRPKKYYGGTGLGLAICKKLVNLLGGEISFTSNPKGTGSSFYFTITSVPKEEKTLKRKQHEESDVKILVVSNLSNIEENDNDLSTLQSFANLLELRLTRISISEIGQPENCIVLLPINLAPKVDVSNVKNLIIYGGTSSPHPHFLPSPFRLRHFKNAVETLAPNISKRHLTYNHLSALVVDDSEINQKVLSKILKTVGLENVKTASSGTDVIETVRKCSSLHLVFMDVNLPGGMDGFQCVKEIRKQFPQFNPFIVILTGSSSPEVYEKAASLGASLIVKPIHLPKVREIIQQCDKWNKSRNES